MHCIFFAGPAAKTGKSDRILALVEVISSLQLDEFLYTEGKISRKNDPAAAAFRNNVELNYHALASPATCWCLLTNDILPSATVVAGHLFKREWHNHIHVLGLTDINDVRNGLPLWKPLKWAFDTSRLCFIYNEELDQFIAHILDPNIMSIGSKRSSANGPQLARTPNSSEKAHIWRHAHAATKICSRITTAALQARSEFPGTTGKKAGFQAGMAATFLELPRLL